MRKPTKAQRECWDASNLAAARIILDAPEKHTRLMIDWATRFMARRAEERTGQKSLFAPSVLPNGTRVDGRL